MSKLILASSSPRRKEILQAAGIEFEAMASHIAEEQRDGEAGEKFVCRMAQEKADAVCSRLGLPSSLPILPSLPIPSILYILGTDTVVQLDGQTFGKPSSVEDAVQMLRQLSGRVHRVLTGLCLISSFSDGGSESANVVRDVRLASTRVKFADMTEQEIQDYVATGEPFDKAGAYAIQGRASKHIEWISGCYFNVVGLPVSLLYQMLREMETSVSPRNLKSS